MPEGKTIEFAAGEYPALDGLEAGAPVTFTGSAVLEDMGNGQMALRISSMDFETEGPADRELKSMKRQDGTGADPSFVDEDDF